MERHPHICVIGSLNIDFVTSTPRCPGPGETLMAKSFSVNAGGKGANQAVACARASFTSKSQQDVVVSMVGAVGEDDVYYRTLLKPNLEQSGVIIDGIKEIRGAQTGSATVILEEARGENRILVVPGANHSAMNDVNCILTTTKNRKQSPDVIVLQGEIPRSTVLGLLQHFNSSTSTTQVIFNPAPVFPEGTPLAAIINTSVLIMNESEAVQMTKSIPDFPVSIQTEADLRPEDLAPHFHQIASIKILLITLGAKGVFFSTIAGNSGFVGGIKVKEVIDTTAAGDTFVGFFAANFARFLKTGIDLREFPIEKAVHEANAAAAICVQRSGAMQSIPFAYQVSQA